MSTVTPIATWTRAGGYFVKTADKALANAAWVQIRPGAVRGSVSVKGQVVEWIVAKEFFRIGLDLVDDHTGARP